MRLSSFNIYKTYKERRAQQEREVKENSIRDNKIVWDIRKYKGWGNSISFFKRETRRVVGWTTPIPKIGDILLAEMSSGKIGSFIFIEVEPQVDPSDMWFATVKDNGYYEDKD